MTSKTSWFNRGIYLSNLRRFAWGGVLYTVVLFLMTVLPVLFIQNKNPNWILSKDLLLTDSYLYLPMLVALFVPTVVALLSFRFVHSKKASVFLHSLPIARKGIFISAILSAFTLMAIPVLVNGILLMLLSLGGYGTLFPFTSCLIWIGLNLLAQVLMFSVATFACFLTGNTFAAVVLNGLIHLLAIAIAGSFASISQVFLYGFYNQNTFFNATTEWNFVSYLLSICENFPYEAFEWGKLALMLVFAGVLYLASWLLYRKRRLETAEDVAGYQILNPIFKYLVTFLAAIGTFAISCNALAEEPFFCILIVGIISLVVYFASEMLLKKTMKVWRSYKGYLAFGGAFFVLCFLFAFTSFFGYETRVPKSENLDAVALFQFGKPEETPYVEDADIIRAVVEAHEELARKENTYRVKRYNMERQFDLQLRYRMKNGSEMARSYIVSEKFFFDVMQKMYTSQEYKQKNLDLFTADIGSIYGVELSNGIRLTEEEAEDFLLCLRADLREVEYADVHFAGMWNTNIYIEYIPSKPLREDYTGREIYSIHQRINASFTNSVAWLREHGHLTSVITGWKQDLALLTEAQWKEYNAAEKEVTEYAANGAEVKVRTMKTIDDIEGVKRIPESQKTNVYTFMVTTPVPFEPGREYAYRLCRVTEEGHLFNVAAFYDTPAMAQLFQYVQ